MTPASDLRIALEVRRDTGTKGFVESRNGAQLSFTPRSEGTDERPRLNCSVLTTEAR